MLSNRLLLELAVQDGLTPVLNHQIAQAKALQKAYSAAASIAKSANFQATGKMAMPKAGGLSLGQSGQSGDSGLSSLFTASTKLGLVAGAAALAFGAITTSVNAISEAAQLQNDALTAAGNVARNLGGSLETSRRIVEGAQDDIQRYASALPGDTKTYQQTFNGLVGSIAKFRKDPEDLTKTTLELTRRIGAQAATTGTDANVMSRSIAAVFAGNKSVGELRQIEGFGRWEGFFDELTNNSKAAGLDQKQIKNWDPKKRFEILKKSIEGATSEELLKAFENSVDGLYQTIKDKYTSPYSGLFGVMRKIVQKDGTQRTVMDSVKTMLTTFKEYQDAFGEIGALLGLGTDPMQTMINLVDGITDTIAKMGEGAKKLMGSDMMDFEKVLEIGVGLGAMVGEWIGSLVASIFSPKGLMTIGNLALGLLGAAFGLLWGVIKGLLGGLWNGWKPLLNDLGVIVKQALIDLGNFIKNQLMGAVTGFGIQAANSTLNGPGSFLGGAAMDLASMTPLGKPIEDVKGAMGTLLEKTVGTSLGLPTIKPDGPQKPDVTNTVSFNVPQGIKEPEQLAAYVLDSLNNQFGQRQQEALA
jgi:hypothetical protein